MGMHSRNKTALVIGGGLAGCEAAWQLAELGVSVCLYEMRPSIQTAAHVTDQLAELVCSNSFRSDDYKNNAVGLLHEEMRRANSLILRVADEKRIPAGGALAVDRNGFSSSIQQAIQSHPRITLNRNEITDLNIADTAPTIIATGPLTSEKLANSIKKHTGVKSLAFFDAISPVIYKDSINFNIAWKQSRYDKAGPGESAGAYINCPLTIVEYETFIESILRAEYTEFKDWEKSTPYFEACLPIEVMASRGIETLRFGPLKPVGLTNPHDSKKPHAVVQLRQDNQSGTLYNIVGFQTKMKHKAQKEIIRTIPGLKEAEFARFGGIHRNTFIESPVLLDEILRLKTKPNIRFAGQITGVEGYVESAAIGLLAGRFLASELNEEDVVQPPRETALGALLHHITEGHLSSKKSFQPMNINFGLFPPFSERKRKADRKPAYAKRALIALAEWL